MNELLRIEGLTIAPATHLARKLVHDVSFVLETGRTTCIVGESGSGKSLTALAVMGLLPPALLRQAGRVVFQGRDLASYTQLQLQDVRGKRIGMIFQEPMTSLNPVLKVGYQIGEGIAVHLGLRGKALQARIAALLEQVGIAAERAGSYPDELSGGQRQRVMVAMSIACDPVMLIADEPTTALDVTVQAQILKLLAELKGRMNMGMLFITHDFGVVADIADDVVVMFRGEVVETGPVDRVLGNPQHPYTRALLDCVPDAEGRKPLRPIDYAWLKEAAR
ncbi:oligopeptide transport ATP-binding protein OppD [mine drainage metagenome]|uniref:Oligopeptide transport ATP-binding protein OppD n=1 Tax=mine drainage metagenome TaxID=410659 RepID=A0A1J5Q2R9_9ZZZZ